MSSLVAEEKHTKSAGSPVMEEREGPTPASSQTRSGAV